MIVPAMTNDGFFFFVNTEVLPEKTLFLGPSSKLATYELKQESVSEVASEILLKAYGIETDYGYLTWYKETA